jgi:hypothetical protein
MLHPLCTLLFLSALTAQQLATTTYVQGSFGGPYGNAVPFGCLTNGLFVEGRSQILIPAPLLPGPNAKLTGIGVHSQTTTGGSGTLTYPLLKITAARGSATGLSPTFASNLVSPVVVLNATNLPIQWVANSWTVIPFSTPYVHDGRSDLVIEIQKIVVPTLDLASRTIQNAGRTDLPRMINALGGAASGAHSAATATVTTNYAPSLQLRWTSASPPGVATLKVRSDAASTWANQFALGRSVDITVQGAPGAPVFHLIAPGIHIRTTTSPLLDGRLWLEGWLTWSQGILPASGETTITLPIPQNSALVGVYLAHQSIVAATPAPPWKVTNAADYYIRS